MKKAETKEVKNFIIAVDGFSSCGKSTLAKDLAKALQCLYIDSGAMYRAVTWYCIKKKIDIDNQKLIEKKLEEIEITFQKIENQNQTFLNGQNIEHEIRGKEVSKLVSEISAISSVRTFLRNQQRSYANNQDVEMDGRDIGTQDFPNADVKLFLNADEDTRSQRRFDELKKKGNDFSLKEIKENLAHRDRIDSTREDSPLTQASDAIYIDNSFLSREEQLKLALDYIEKSIGRTTVIPADHLI